MRLFVAVDLDERARGAIAAEQRRLEHQVIGATSLRWTRPGQIHLTLAFLGEVDPSTAALFQADMTAPVALEPFDLTLAGVGAFPPRGAPRALWIGIRDGSHELEALYREVAARILRRGLPLESRPFNPHLTVARWKTSRPSDRSRALGHAGGGVIARLKVDHATLYQSRISSEGSTYTELARATLTGERAENRR